MKFSLQNKHARLVIAVVLILIFLPLIRFGVAQTAGKVLYDMPMFVLAAAVLLALDVTVLVASVRLFQRETILTRWK